MPEWSKGADLSSAGFGLVGSNPTLCKPRFFTKKFLCGLMVIILGFHPRVRGSIPPQRKPKITIWLFVFLEMSSRLE
jgi:hypothetical protein